MKVIIGGGLAGLLAGALERRTKVLEAQPRLPHNHHAVLRFRTPRIGEALNIPFRRVRVLKDIWEEGKSVEMTPARANAYARKCTGAVTQRSLTQLDKTPVERFIAPPDLVQQMADLVGDRLELGCAVDSGFLSSCQRPLISTMPLPALLKLLNWPSEGWPEFGRQSGIFVDRYEVPGADVFQTVYFPSPETSVYRASITGSELMVERLGGVSNQDELIDTLGAFGLRPHDVRYQGTNNQRLGKIVELPAAVRKPLLARITREHSIWCLGRFATWRNVLLDDVLDDIFHIRAMAEMEPYDQLRRAAR